MSDTYIRRLEKIVYLFNCLCHSLAMKQVFKMYNRAKFLIRHGDNPIARKLLLRCIELNPYDSHRFDHYYEAELFRVAYAFESTVG